MSKTVLITGIVVVIAIIVVGFFFLSNFINPFNMNSSDQQASVATTTPSQNANGLVVQDETVGAGATAEPGDVLTVNYTGKLQDGTVFDTSVGKTPFQFTLGEGQVIPGWDQGLVGMQVGGKRILIIPPSLAYGAQAVGPIPANSTLVFEVDLLSVEAATTTPTQGQ